MSGSSDTNVWKRGSSSCIRIGSRHQAQRNEPHATQARHNSVLSTIPPFNDANTRDIGSHAELDAGGDGQPIPSRRGNEPPLRLVRRQARSWHIKARQTRIHRNTDRNDVEVKHAAQEPRTNHMIMDRIPDLLGVHEVPHTDMSKAYRCRPSGAPSSDNRTISDHSAGNVSDSRDGSTSGDSPGRPPDNGTHPDSHHATKCLPPHSTPVIDNPQKRTARDHPPSS